MKMNTIKNLIKRFGRDWREFSLPVAVGRVVLDCPIGKWEKRQHFYENRVYNYLKKRYGKTLKCEIANHAGNGARAKKRIWVMWWQGVEGMPPIVQACYRQLLKVKKDWEVVLITKENWAEYVSFPEYVINKVENGTISLTHFSDLIRVALLSKYGGAWFDATIYAFDLPKELERDEFFTLHAPGMFPQFLSRGEWIPFLLYCPYENMGLPEFMKKVFMEYWNEHSKLIDYLFVDYVIKMVSEEDEETKKAITKCPINHHYYDLNLAINDKYEGELFKRIGENSCLQKLTYKKEFAEKCVDGEKTFYGWIKEK